MSVRPLPVEKLAFRLILKEKYAAEADREEYAEYNAGAKPHGKAVKKQFFVHTHLRQAKLVCANAAGFSRPKGGGSKPQPYGEPMKFQVIASLHYRSENKYKILHGAQRDDVGRGLAPAAIQSVSPSFFTSRL